VQVAVPRLGEQLVPPVVPPLVPPVVPPLVPPVVPPRWHQFVIEVTADVQLEHVEQLNDCPSLVR
jgi:hypothetical protein